MEAQAENEAEKRRHFEENLELIRASQLRLSRHQLETEHVLSDLMTRWEDKLLKCNDISHSFQAFKK
jgi:hypothetical protein